MKILIYWNGGVGKNFMFELFWFEFYGWFFYFYFYFLGSYVIVFYMFNVYSYYIVSRYGIICVGKSYVIFKVWVCNDVYLVLMMYDCDSGFLYEIVIGGWGNG